MRSEPETYRLLDELCVDLGLCLPPAERSRLAQHPAQDAREFTKAVFLAEGLDIELADRRFYRQARARVAAACERCG